MLYLEDYLEMIEHLPQELRDRFTEMREMDLSVQNVIDSLEKRVRILFSQCRRNEMPQGQADNEFTNLRRDYYKVLEDADEKVHLASQMYDLVERYLRRLDSELHKFKCELEADHNGITEILEKRSLELDGNSNSMLNSLISGVTGSAGVTNNSQKENRYFGSVSSGGGGGGGGGGHSNSHGSVRDRDRYRHKAEKRRDSNNGPSSMGSGGPPPEKRQMMSNSMGGMNHNNVSSGGGAGMGIHSGSSSLQANNFNAINPMATIRSGGQNVNMNAHYGGGSHSHHGSVSHSSSSSSSSSLGPNLNLHSASLSHSGGANPVLVTTTLGTGANAVNLGSTSFTAESEVMRAASQAITMTHQMQQGRRTASLKASVEAATSGGVAGGSGQDLLGRELVGATHNAIQAVERESFNSNQRRHKKKMTSMSSMPSMGSSSSNASLQLTSLETSSAVTGVRMDENGMIVESTADGEWTYDPNEPRYCICNQVSYGDMVACDNDVCPFEWFHYPCVGITQSPKGKWYCPQCTSSMKRRGSRKT